MNCARYGCSLKDHCKGGVEHSNYKEEARMVPLKWRRPSKPCQVRHCLVPLCSCVDFVESEVAA
jgi:hypothetical protein